MGDPRSRAGSERRDAVEQAPIDCPPSVVTVAAGGTDDRRADEAEAVEPIDVVTIEHAGVAVEIRNVKIPEILERPQIVVQKTPNEIEIAEARLEYLKSLREIEDEFLKAVGRK